MSNLSKISISSPVRIAAFAALVLDPVPENKGEQTASDESADINFRSLVLHYPRRDYLCYSVTFHWKRYN